jgi:predicted XRE-type DNA-binding protein
MIYQQEILDRKTGELISVDQGDWITIRELGEVFGLGRRQTTTVLRKMGFLQVKGGGSNSRHRIADWVVEKGWGKRLKRKRDKYPFDVIGPQAFEWIKERWAEALSAVERERLTEPVQQAREALDEYLAYRGSDTSVQMMICWLADFFPALTQKQIGTVLDVSQPLVSRFLAIRAKQRSEAAALKSNRFDQMEDDDRVISLVA